MTSPFISQDVYLNNIGLDGIISSPGGGSSVFPSGIVVHVTSTNYTYQTFNNGDTIRRTNGGVAMFDTLPEAKTNIYYPNGWVIWVENSDTVSLTITPVVSTINGLTSLVLSPEQTTRIISDGLNYYAFVTTSSSSIVTSIEGLTGAVLLSAGTGISIPAPSGQTITVNNTGVTGIEANTSGTLHTGSINFINGTNTTIVDNGSGVFQINTTTGAGGVSSINTTAVGGVTITSTTGVSVGTAGSTITLGNTGVTAIEANTSGTLRTGTINFINGTNTTVVDNGGGSFQINVPSGAGGVTTFNSSTGAITLVSGTNTTVVANGGGSFQTNVATGNSITTVSSAIEVNSPVNAQIGVTNYAYVTSDRGKTVNRSNGLLAMTDTIPQAGSTGFPNGWFTTINNVSVTTPNASSPTFNSTIILTSTTSTINGEASILIPVAQSCTITSDGTNWFATIPQSYGNTNNPTYDPNGIIIGPGGLTILANNLYGYGPASSGISVITQGTGNAGNNNELTTPSAISQVSDRVAVSVFASTYDRPPEFPVNTAVGYTTTSITVGTPVTTSLLRVNMIIDTNDTPKFSGIITSWGSGTTTTTLNVSGWFQVAGYTLTGFSLTTGGTGYVAGDVVSIFAGAGYTWPALITINTVNGSGTVLTFTLSYIGSYADFVPTVGTICRVKGGTGTGATFTVTSWSQIAGNAAAGQVPSGALVRINCINTIWAANFSTINRATTIPGVTGFVGLEIDIPNATTYNDDNTTQQLTGLLIGTVGASSTYVGSNITGYMYNCYMASANTINAGFLYAPSGSSTACGFLSNQLSGYLTQAYQSSTGTAYAVTAHTGNVDIGRFGVAGVGSTATINFHSASQAVSGTYNAYDGQISCINGTDGTPGVGTMTYIGGAHLFESSSSTRSFTIHGVTNAVNYINVTPNVTGSAPLLQAQGSDTNVNLFIASQGSGSTINIRPGGVNGLVVNAVASPANYLTVTQATTGTAVIIATSGADLTPSLNIAPLGNLTLNTNSGGGFGTIIQGAGVTRMTVISGIQVGASPTGGDEGVGTINAAGAYYSNGVTITDTAGHYISSIATPGIAAGAGAGTGPTVSVVGTDNAGTISVTAGTTPTTSSTIVTITFTNVFAHAPIITLIPNNSNAFLLQTASTTFVTWVANTLTLVLTSGTVGLTNALVYTWQYHAMH